MPSEIMNKVAAAERACDEKKAQARAEANRIVSEAEKKAAMMKKEAEAFARAKTNAIVGTAAKEAQRRISEGASADGRSAAALKEASAEKLHEAVRQTALYLLELS